MIWRLINLDIKWTKIKQEHMYDRDDRLTAYYVCQLGFSKKKEDNYVNINFRVMEIVTLNKWIKFQSYRRKNNNSQKA